MRIILILTLLLNCVKPQIAEQDSDLIEGKGTLKLENSQDNTYIIVTDDNKHYMPSNLPDRFEVNGLDVEFRGLVDSTKSLKNVRLSSVPIILKSIKKTKN